MSGLITVPRAIDGELGRDKVQSDAVLDLDTSATAQEYNTVKNAVATMAQRFGPVGDKTFGSLEYWMAGGSGGRRLQYGDDSKVRFYDQFTHLLPAWTPVGPTLAIEAPHQLKATWGGAQTLELADSFRYLPLQWEMQLRIKIASPIGGHIGVKDTPGTSYLRLNYGHVLYPNQWWLTASSGVEMGSLKQRGFELGQWHTIVMRSNPAAFSFYVEVDGKGTSVRKTSVWPTEKDDYKFEVYGNGAGDILLDYFALEFDR